MNDLDAALAALDRGSPIVIPTDTVYGIAARPELPDAIGRVFAAKGRPDDRPLPVLGAGLDDLRPVADLDERAVALAGRFWPGPLTLVVPRSPSFAGHLGSVDDGTVAVRVPAHPSALELLGRSGPLAVTSANLSGRPPATTVAQAREALQRGIEVFVDGGPSIVAAPSTIVSLVGTPKVLREGELSALEVLRELS